MPRKSKQPRIAPVSPPLDEATQDALERLGAPIQLFRVFARRPALANALADWGGYYFSRQAALEPRHRELVVDRTSALCGADYELAVHVDRFAGRVGLTSPQLRSLARGAPTDACWTDPADRAVLTAVDELHTTFDLCDQTWSGLVEAVGDDAALELALVCGWYHAIAFTVRALRLPLEPGTQMETRSMVALTASAAQGDRPPR